MKRKLMALLLAGLMMTAAACGNPKDTAKDDGGTGTTAPTEINVVSREDGSGTRGAFIELFGIEEKTDDGKKVDRTSMEAAITNNTAVMMTTIAGDPAAIGYISLGSLNDTVKALEIDGAAATAANVESGEYKISRPFNIATKADLSAAGADFVSFIMSDEGQAIVGKDYIAVESKGAYTPTDASGKVTVAGSSSVTPIMEKLKEAYAKVNDKVEIEVQQSDSTTGMNNASEGVCDIGMASRALKDSELEAGLTATVIATDGIAVIVNNESSVSGLTAEQIKEIFTGSVTSWADVAK